MGNICQPKKTIFNKENIEQDFDDDFSFKKATSTVYHDKANYDNSPEVSTNGKLKYLPSPGGSSAAGTNFPFESPSFSQMKGKHYYEDESLGRYLILRSFLPNGNNILKTCPDFQTTKDSVLLVVRIDGLSEIISYCSNVLWSLGLANSQKSFSDLNNEDITNNTSDEVDDIRIKVHNSISGYLSKVIQLISKEHGGTIESMKGDELLCSFQRFESDSNHTSDKRSISRNTSMRGSTMNLIRGMKSETQKKIESCRRASQCGHFLIQKMGSFKINLPSLDSDEIPSSANSQNETESCKKWKTFSLSIRCAVGIGNKSEVNLTYGPNSLWKRILFHDGISQISPFVERDPTNNWESFGSFIKNEDDSSSDSNHSSPISLKRLNSINIQSFRNMPNQRTQLFDGCFVSDEIRNYIATYFSLLKISLPEKRATAFKVIGIKDWIPLPEETKDNTYNQEPILEEKLMNFAPPFLQKYLNEEAFGKISFDANDQEEDLESPTNPNFQISTLKHFILQESSVMTVRFDYLNKEDEFFIQYEIFKNIYNLISFSVSSVSENANHNVYQSESGVIITTVFQNSIQEMKGLQRMNSKRLLRHSHENSTSRIALRAALNLRRLYESISDSSVSICIGITTGTVYTGIVGSDLRREIVFLGNCVDQSEKLASVPGQIVVDNSTYMRTMTSTIYSEIKISKESNQTPQSNDKFKFDNSTSTYIALDLIPDIDFLHAEGDDDWSCFKDETNKIIDKFRQFVTDRKFESIAIMGKQGSGKTELSRRLLTFSRREITNLRRCQLKCWKKDSEIPYLFLQFFILTFVTDLKNLSLQDRKSFLKYILRTEQIDKYEPYLDLLNPIFVVDFPKSIQSKSLSSSERVKMLHYLIYYKFIVPYLNITPTLVFIDDVQNMDTASSRFIDYLMDEKPNNLFIIFSEEIPNNSPREEPLSARSTKSNDTSLKDDISIEKSNSTTPREISTNATSTYKDRTYGLVINLLPLEEEGIRRLVVSLFKSNPQLLQESYFKNNITLDISPSLLSLLLNNSRGSPFLIDQILSLLSERKELQIKELNKKRVVDLLNQTNIELVVHENAPSERFNALPSFSKRLIIVICIICSFSPTFQESMLYSLISDVEKIEIQDALQTLISRRFVQIYSNSPKLYMLFSDYLREVLYNLISIEEKKELHHTIAIFLEKSKDSIDHSDEIAYHYLQYVTLEKNLTSSILDSVVLSFKVSINHRKIENDFIGARELQRQLIFLFQRQAKSTTRDIILAESYLDEASILEEIESSSSEIKESILSALNIAPQNAWNIICLALERLWNLDYNSVDWSYNNYQKDTGSSLLKKLKVNSIKSKSIQHILESYRCSCKSLYYLEKYEKVCIKASQAYELYKKENNNAVKIDYNRNQLHPLVEIFMLGCLANWFLARTRIAHSYFSIATEIFSEFEYPLSKCYYLLFSCVYSYLNGDIYQIIRNSEDAYIIINQYGYTSLINHVKSFLGYSKVILGDRDGLEIQETSLQMGIYNYALYSVHIPLMYITSLLALGNDQLQKCRNFIEKEFEGKENSFNSYLQCEIQRLKGICLAKEGDLDKASIQFEKAIKIAQNASLTMIKIRSAIDAIEYCSPNKNADDNTTSYSDSEKRLREKHLTMLRKILKEIINEDTTKDMTQYSKYTDPEEIEKLGNYFPDLKRTQVDQTWNQPTVESLRQNGIMFDGVSEH